MQLFFFFNDTATTEIYTLSLHDALPIFLHLRGVGDEGQQDADAAALGDAQDGGELRLQQLRALQQDRKSTRLNSSYANISYAVFCLKKRNTTTHASSRSYDFRSSL